MSGAGAASASAGAVAAAPDGMTRQELVATVGKQTEQLRRYETRLRDVVTAYKGLVKQKEALETSLNALNKSHEKSAEDDSVAALTLSLSTLNAEKSRMEEAFQADKRMTREKYENTIHELREEIKSAAQQHQGEVNNLKAKLTFEIQEREKERADHTAMLKELHGKLNSERKSKEKLEDKFVISADSQGASVELEKRVRDLSGELEAAQRRLARAEARTVETPQMLLRLQEKMALLQQGHAAAIRQEQIKARLTEETARKLCASQEERVAALEARLAELSHTVGEYDARRRRDELLIRQLRDGLNRQILEHAGGDCERGKLSDSVKLSETDNEKLADTEYLQNVIDKIHILKQELIAENSKLGSPIDVAALLSGSDDNVHQHCREEIEELREELETCKRQLSERAEGFGGGGAGGGGGGGGDGGREAERLLTHAHALQEQLECVAAQLQDERAERELLARQAEENLLREQSYHKEVSSDLRGRIVQLERQLATQRERYSQLLAETDSYIRATGDRERRISTEEGSLKDTANLQESAPPHMLHYAHELARRDLDIAQLRRDKHALEGQVRDSQRDATIEKERMKEVLRNLKEEIDRLHRIQSREGANLEYLKNVVLSYVVSSDLAGRRHMLNAIAAVLHFTEAERSGALAAL